MGYSRTFGDVNTLPEYFCNHGGYSSWSGKRADELTEELIADLEAFCINEGSRQGNNDFVQGRVPENEHFFHRDLAGGWVNDLWQRSYWAGVDNARRRQAKVR